MSERNLVFFFITLQTSCKSFIRRSTSENDTKYNIWYYIVFIHVVFWRVIVMLSVIAPDILAVPDSPSLLDNQKWAKSCAEMRLAAWNLVVDS